MTMNLYSATHFRTAGSSVQNDSPRLIADDGRIVSVGNLKWSDHRMDFESLSVGHSSVIALAQDGILVTEGWRVRRLPVFAINMVAFDSHAKEFVLISNGTDGLGALVPTEAIALRPMLGNGKVALGWTYRKVDAVDLESLSADQAKRIGEEFKAVLGKRRSARFIGRI